MKGTRFPSSFQNLLETHPVLLSISLPKYDGFVKSPTAARQARGPEHSRRAALRFIFRKPPIAGFRKAQLAFGAFYCAVPFMNSYEFIKGLSENWIFDRLVEDAQMQGIRRTSVSYTHLTLPTTPYV